ncbi:MAG: TRAM domain-containing protein [Elusimicrobiota bacterium]|jgi:uncharacterized protein YacL|nr:TRAM domain-containing protein [Elusimicrobiota bacterium]
MPLWVFRISALIGIPFLVYMFVSNDYYSVMLGLLCGAIIVAAENFVHSLKFVPMMIAIFGALLGFMIYFLCDYAVYKMNIGDISEYWQIYKTAAAGILCVLCAALSLSKASELEGINKKGRHIKIIDMSALIDGRVIDLCEAGFLEGTLVLPRFVIDKLNIMAASKEQLEKAKGRRGLDIVTRLRELKDIRVTTTAKDVKGENMAERVVALAEYFGGSVVTVDFNINKTAVLRDVPVLNISDLTTALKPVLLPGESMSLFIMKEGKEPEQGIGYLDDGTMVVVEEGQKWIGKRAEVAVYSILQTSAGRMIFAKTKQAAAQE